MRGEFSQDLAGPGTAEERRRAIEVTAALGMEPRLLRLIGAVHEAGHAIVASTVGFEVTEARVESMEMIGSGTDQITVDFSRYPGRIIPLTALLAMKAAGFQASFTWLEGRGIDGAEESCDFALNTMAGDDIHWCLNTCRQLGRLGLSMQDGIEGAGRILKRRWRAVLKLAHALAARGVLAGDDLRPYLAADFPQHIAAVHSYQAWRQKTGPLWRRDSSGAARESRPA
jgi:hypothetical protein